MPETQHSESLQNIYLERSGKGSRFLAETLLEPPLDPLNELEKHEVQQFEAELCEYQLDETLTIKSLLNTWKGEALEAPHFFADAFLKGEVHAEGLEGALRQFDSPEDVYAWLAQAALDKTVDPAVLRDLAKQSATFYITEASQALLREAEPPIGLMERMPIVLDPEKSLQYATAELKAREYLLALRGEYDVHEHKVPGAKRALVDIYLKRINGLIASDIPVLEYLIQQSELIDDSESVVSAYLAMPAGLCGAVSNPEQRVILNKRLDFLRNGIGTDADGHASAVAEEVFTTPESLSSQENAPPLFTLEQRDALMNTEVEPEQMRELFTEVVRDANLLSSEDAETWFPGRGHRAADGLFQVVFNPTKNNFAVNGVDGVLQVPKGPRSLYDVIVVGIHELTHINQTQADRALGEELQIGEIKGRRVSMLRETGANISQRQAERILFGVSKPVQLTYARAIQTVEAGGNMFDAAKAFFQEKSRIYPEMPKVTAAKEAADRVMRLILAGGANSQPMAYAEENIMNEELRDATPEVRARATMATSLDLDDQERLHRFGLLTLPEDNTTDWMGIMIDKARPYIDRAIS